MDGRSTIPSETRQAGIVIRSPQATVSFEDRLTPQEVQMTEVLRILRDQGAAISEMAASLTTEPPEQQRLYPRLHEGNGRQGFASTERQSEQNSRVVPEQRHTEVRDEGDQFDKQSQDQQGRRDRHLGQQRGDEGQVVYVTALAPVEQIATTKIKQQHPDRGQRDWSQGQRSKFQNSEDGDFKQIGQNFTIV
ncbi:hypothetical protein Sjap_022155 [Stephania japonica]|uniref:Uncharacterized protein n=1 Tax=Stephania japonica TaxID=461633 RepID=A0AAP0HPL5_9MAGN